ncbi:MAG: bifunctional ornithine acetyltransferase/N-acetylglutamate synthase [Clostridia bacterium]|nr:bifunctional ornithine acetyltransferase/N-acetylglutamate synthase [Clostridia bacterium]
MRKNGVNRELEPIEGGVCAPAGFTANGAGGLALIAGEKRFPAAGVFSQSAVIGAPVSVSKRHIKSGYARAVFINSGVANVCQENGEREAKEICGALAKRLHCDTEEILIASTGKIGPRFQAEEIVRGLDFLTQGLGASHGHSIAAARAIMTTDKAVKQLSFAFDLGDFRCKIGAVFKGNARVCPNMATTLCVLTTDVNITPQMLQKALSFATNETLNMLNFDGLASPNDTTCIFSSRAAGNYAISCADSEYKKFVSALQKTLFEVCLTMIKDGDSTNQTLVCQTIGAKSKRVARAVAKSVISARLFQDKALQTEDLLCAMLSAGEALDLRGAEITLSGKNTAITLMMDGKVIAFSASTVSEILSCEEILLCINLNDGNYGATALGRIAGKTF